MPAAAETMIAVIVAMVGGLLVFATVLLAGVALVRSLRLPQDLPDGPRFEPPPPPVRARGDRASALLAAERQAAIAALYARARALESAGRECQELAHALGDALGRAPEAAALSVQLKAAAEACAAADAALRAFDRRLRAAPTADAGAAALADELAARAPVVQAALAEARRLAAAHAPPQPARRLLLLLLAVLLLWLAVLVAVLWR